MPSQQFPATISERLGILYAKLEAFKKQGSDDAHHVYSRLLELAHIVGSIYHQPAVPAIYATIPLNDEQRAELRRDWERWIATEKPSATTYHDDTPCKGRLDSSGKCTVCGITPDMQSISIGTPAVLPDAVVREWFGVKESEAMERPTSFEVVEDAIRQARDAVVEEFRKPDYAKGLKDGRIAAFREAADLCDARVKDERHHADYSDIDLYGAWAAEELGAAIRQLAAREEST